MSLADRIIDERKQAHWSQEELARRLGVSRQAVSKWESEQAVPDLSRMVQMADLFGTSTDYLLKGEEAGVERDGSAAPHAPARFVSEDEARAFLAFKQQSIPKIALGVALCIVSPALLVMLTGFGEDGVAGLTNELGIAIGLPALFILVGAAVYIFVTQGVQNEKFEYLEKEKVLVAEPAKKEVSELRAAQTESFGRNMAIGIALCVVAGVPLVIASCFVHKASVICAFVALLLVIVAAGVHIMVRAASAREAYDMLLQIQDYSPDEKAVRQKLNTFSGVFWLVVTAIYLAASFVTGKWGATWAVWAVAGVLYGAAYAVALRVVKK